MKPGVKYTELYVTLGTIAIGALLQSGALGNGSAAEVIAGAILQAASALGYGVSRTALKRSQRGTSTSPGWDGPYGEGTPVRRPRRGKR